MPDRHHHLQQAFEGSGGVVPKHGDLAIALRRKPVELNDPALADKRFVAVPRIVAALERQQRSGDRGDFDDDVVEILRGSQQAEPAARLIPALVHVKKDSNDLGLRIGVDLAVGGTASATHCRDRGSSRQIDPKFVLECLAERIAVEFIKQRLKRWAKYNLIDRKATGRRDLRIIAVDFGQRRRSDKLRDDQMFKRLALQRSRAELLDAEIM